MIEFISFIKEYKEVILSSVCLILTLICILVKRKPKTIDEFYLLMDEVIVKLPSFINSVEVSGNGLDKKRKVLSSALSLLTKKLGRDLSIAESEYFVSKISNSIEMILSTPQKKGV